MTKTDIDQTAQLADILERFMRRFKVSEATAAMEHALNGLDIQALLFINDHPGCALGDVARELQVALTTMSSSVDRLVRREMLQRERPEFNRRTVALTLTTAGRQDVRRYVDGYRDTCGAMLAALDQVEREQLVKLMGKALGSDNYTIRKS
ncbi:MULTISPECIES: MarR family winged helix-turn-helix transcriptional regulator [unclassified Brevundimonas]|uniref:MarR family winged helix-turn-helix transcriptional regulator n=1 Tax=unclassified Brevundimonas TaxID=2622653 RepID=UPI0025C516D0|nr:MULTISPECIES: MarR family winged helix-turn-helix transcriptional regulator [unclassified Brevundimonas]